MDEADKKQSSSSGENSKHQSDQEQEPSSDPQKTKASSYTYWVTGKSEFNENHAPKKIVTEEEKKIAQQPKHSSAWNTGGTWEHKTLKNEEVKSKLMEKIKADFNPLQRFKYEITGISTFKGETTVLVTRGKAKVGFDYSSIEFTWRGKEGTKLEECEGTIKVKNLADDDPDDRSVVYKVTKTSESLDHKEAKEIIRRTAVGVVDPLLEGFRSLH